MAGGQTQEQEGSCISEINVTPLVDIMLVLLIIFMVTTTLLVSPSIPLSLPKSDSAERITSSPQDLQFSIDKDQKLYFNGQEVKLEEISDLIKGKKDQSFGKELHAIIQADGKTPHEVVIRLLDLIRKNEITDFLIDVEGA